MKAELVARSELEVGERRSMYRLLCRHFEGITRPRFEADLAEKDWVLLLRGKEPDELDGFSTLQLRHSRFGGREISVVYSGDTVVDPRAWSSSRLAQSWIGAVNHLRRATREPLYWLLLTSGFRTYRFLPVFWRVFDPSPAGGAPAELAELRGFLAAERFGALYDPAAGVVRFPQPQILRPALRGIPAGRLSDPATAFFARRNPSHERGDELVCLTEISWSNLTPAGQRMWRAGQGAVQVPMEVQIPMKVAG